MVLPLGSQTGNVDPVESDSIDGTDFTVVRQSVTNSGLPSNNRFRFQGNVVEVNRMLESMCNDFAPTISSRTSGTVYKWTQPSKNN
jgi:hypothetical protein